MAVKEITPQQAHDTLSADPTAVYIDVRTAQEFVNGHPADAVLQRYHERQAVVVDSPHCGAFTWQSWQPQSGVCQRQLARRYWHHSLP